MGKKPVAGLVGLCCLGLTLSGCSGDRCGCGKGSRQEGYPVARRQAAGGPGGIAHAGAPYQRPRSAGEMQVMSRGGTQAPVNNPYNFPPESRDVPTPAGGGAEASGFAGTPPAQPDGMSMGSPAVSKSLRPQEMPGAVQPAQRTETVPPGPAAIEVAPPATGPGMITPPGAGPTAPPAVKDTALTPPPALPSNLPAAPSVEMPALPNTPTSPAVDPVASPAPPPGAGAGVPAPAEGMKLPETSRDVLPPPPPVNAPQVGPAPAAETGGAPRLEAPTPPPPSAPVPMPPPPPPVQ